VYSAMHWINSSRCSDFTFQMYDTDGSGSIEEDEMIEVMTALYNTDGQSGLDAAAAQARRIFNELDVNGDGELSCEEFVRGCMQDPELVRMITAGGIDPEDLDKPD
jgi:Ca2+-binding EF-hand superfamily protein